MSNVHTNLIKSFQQQGYMLMAAPGLDPNIPEARDLVSHDRGIVIGPDGETVPFRELLAAGACIDDRYNEGAAALLGKLVANRTQGRFPERWVGVSTGDRKMDEETIARIASYTLGTFSHLLAPEDKVIFDSDSSLSKSDLFYVAHRLNECLEEIAESEIHPQLNLWQQNVRSVVENFMRGVHVARVNKPLPYDNGSMLAFLADVVPSAGVYIGTRHGIPFGEIRKRMEMGTPIEMFLNPVEARTGTWHVVQRGQPFKAAAGVVAELVMRDRQRSAKLLGGNIDMALTDEAIVGPERVKRQKVGPLGPVNNALRTWKMGAGKLYLRGVEFVGKEAEPFGHKAKDKYRHVRVTEGAVNLIVRDNCEVLEAGDSALVLPGVAFMVGTSEGHVPSSYVVSTLSGLTPRRQV